MTIETGEVYLDNVFNSETTIIEVNAESLIIYDCVGGWGDRDYRRWQFEHNVNVGRFEKIDEKDVVKGEESSENDSRGIFDY